MKKLKKVVLVDDDEIFLYIVTKMLSKTHLVDTLLTFKNGQDALDYLVENDEQKGDLPDIIILDLSMPIIDGWQFLDIYKNIKTQDQTKIYICSSSISPDEIEKSKTYKEISNFYIKPLSENQLLNILNN